MARQSHINYDVDLATGVKLERDDWSKSTNEIIEKVSIAQLKHCHLKFAHHCFSRISIWSPRLATWCNLTWHIVTTVALQKLWCNQQSGLKITHKLKKNISCQHNINLQRDHFYFINRIEIIISNQYPV